MTKRYYGFEIPEEIVNLIKTHVKVIYRKQAFSITQRTNEDAFKIYKKISRYAREIGLTTNIMRVTETTLEFKTTSKLYSAFVDVLMEKADEMILAAAAEDDAKRAAAAVQVASVEFTFQDVLGDKVNVFQTSGGIVQVDFYNGSEVVGMMFTKENLPHLEKIIGLLKQ